MICYEFIYILDVAGCGDKKTLDESLRMQQYLSVQFPINTYVESIVFSRFKL
jgi:hypothetical protein